MLQQSMDIDTRGVYRIGYWYQHNLIYRETLKTTETAERLKDHSDTYSKYIQYM